MSGFRLIRPEGASGGSAPARQAPWNGPCFAVTLSDRRSEFTSGGGRTMARVSRQRSFAGRRR